LSTSVRDDGTEFAPICWSGRNAGPSRNNGDGAMRNIHLVLRGLLSAVAGAILLAAVPAMAEDAAGPDKVKVGVFPISSSLPYFVALDLGYFKELNLEPETSVLMGGPPNVAALITNQIEVSAVLVTLEGLNADVKKPGVAMYVAMHSQNAKYKMEQFVVRSGLADKVKSLADFKGLKLMSAPGPANLNTAKGILAKVGLKDGDYTIDQLDMGQHVNAVKAGTFDGGYTLEPSATIMHNLGIADTVEAGVIAKYILGSPDADAYAAGCAFTTDFITKRPDVAKRFAQGWSKAIDYIRANPEAARKYLAKNTMTPDNVVDTVPMLGYIMTKDMSPKQLGYLQEFADFGQQIGVVPEKIDVKQDLKSF
jgi:NitT/TauT family transport system substrate-binding protein